MTPLRPHHLLLLFSMPFLLFLARFACAGRFVYSPRLCWPTQSISTLTTATPQTRSFRLVRRFDSDDETIAPYHVIASMKEPGKSYHPELKPRVLLVRFSQHLPPPKSFLGFSYVPTMAVAKTSYKNEPDSRVINSLFVEADLLKRAQSDYVVRSLGILDNMTSSKRYALLTEYVSGGNLDDYLAQSPKLPKEFVRLLFAQMVLAVRHLHRVGIVHRDIKFDNFVVGYDPIPDQINIHVGAPFQRRIHIRLIDFGFAIKVDAYTAHHNCGSYGFAAPELYHEQVRLTDPRSTDVYALACVFIYLIDPSSRPKEDMGTQAFIPRLSYYWEQRLPKPWVVILRAMLDPKPANRPSLEVVAKDQSWFGVGGAETAARPWLNQPGFGEAYMPPAAIAHSVMIGRHNSVPMSGMRTPTSFVQGPAGTTVTKVCQDTASPDTSCSIQ